MRRGADQVFLDQGAVDCISMAQPSHTHTDGETKKVANLAKLASRRKPQRSHINDCFLPPDLDCCALRCNLLKYWPGEIIFEEGCADTSMMAGLCSGLVDVYVGGLWVDRVEEAGVLVGHFEFFSGLPRMATCRNPQPPR